MQKGLLQPLVLYSPPVYPDVCWEQENQEYTHAEVGRKSIPRFPKCNFGPTMPAQMPDDTGSHDQDAPDHHSAVQRCARPHADREPGLRRRAKIERMKRKAKDTTKIGTTEDGPTGLSQPERDSPSRE